MIFPVFFSLFYNCPLRSQGIFSVQNPYYSPENVNSIIFSGSTGWCAGNNGMMLKTTDGINWTGQAIFTGQNFKKIFSAGTSVIYSLSDSGIMFRTINGGTNWTRLSITEPGITDFTFVNQSTGYSITGIKIGKTLNSGDSWVFSKPDSTRNYLLYGIFALNPQTLYLSTKDPVSAYTSLLKSTDGGNGWIVYNTYIDDFDITKIIFRDDLTGWCTGMRFEKLFFMKTTDGGSNWNVCNIPFENGNPNNMQFSGSSGGIITTQNGLYTTTNSGSDWIKKQQGYSYTSSYLKDDSIIYISDSYGKIFRLNAVTFSQDTIYGKYNTSLTKLQIIQPGVVWASGLNNANVKTTNGGTNWLYDVNSSRLGIKSVFFTDAVTGYGLTGRGTVKKTTDFGNNWITLYDTTAELESFCFINQQTGWIFGKNIILRTGSGGINWNVINTTMSFSEPQFFSQSRGICLNNAGIYITTDGGYNWTEALSGNIMDFNFINLNTGWCISSTDTTSTILKTTNGGYNWNFVTKIAESAGSIKFINDNTGYLSGQRIILRTTNSGVTWKSAGFPVSVNIRMFGLDIQDENTGWVCGDNSAIIKIINGSYIFINPSETVSYDFALYGNYPNPFNPATRIRYGLRKPALIRISVYDITGREIRVLEEGMRQPGGHETLFDGSGLSSGIYFCLMKSGDGNVINTRSIRMVLLK